MFYKGAATSAQSIIPPGLDGGAQKDYVNPYSVYDLSKAKVLLAEAGYPEGRGLPIITLDVPSNTFHKQRGEHFQRCMGRLGVKIRVIPHMFSELLKRIDQRKTMLHLIGWSADYPDAESFLSLLYRADQKSGVGMHFQDDAYDMLYEQATSMVPSRERTLLYEALNRIAASRVPAIYTLRQPHAILYHGWVTNYTTTTPTIPTTTPPTTASTSTVAVPLQQQQQLSQQSPSPHIGATAFLALFSSFVNILKNPTNRGRLLISTSITDVWWWWSNSSTKKAKLRFKTRYSTNIMGKG